MARKGVTLSDVQRAMAALKARNQSTSADNIRAYLGTGNKATILNFKAQLEGSQDLGDVAPPETLPEELVEVLSAAAAGWYGRARQNLQEHVEAARGKVREYELQQAEIRAEAVAAQTRSDEAEEALASVRMELAASKAEKATLKDELRRAQSELASALGAAASERARAEAAATDARAARCQTAEELTTRISLERANAALLEAAKGSRGKPTS